VKGGKMRTEEKGRFTVIYLEESKIGVENIAKVKKDILDAVVSAKDAVIIDFSKVDYLDSSGMGMLLSLQKKSQGKELRLCGLNDAVSNLLKLTKLDTIFKIYSTVDEALK
jgi:anti-sigma B factor antagonist